MAYNPYNYGYYNNSPYQANNNYYNPQGYYQQQALQQPIQQQNFIPLTFTNGFIGAKAYTMMYPNSTIYLQDSESDRLFIKKADSQGKCTLETYRLVKEEIDENGNSINKNNEQKELPKDYLTKDDVVNFASKSDLQALQDTLIDSLNKLSSEIKNGSQAPFTRPNQNFNPNNNNNKRGK